MIQVKLRRAPVGSAQPDLHWQGRRDVALALFLRRRPYRRRVIDREVSMSVVGGEATAPSAVTVDLAGMVWACT
jgi:hypothetical protein